MNAPSQPPPLDSSARGSTQKAGTSISEGAGRTFPCEGCGADLTFHIGQQRLKCPYCGYEKEIEIAETAAVVEQDFDAMIERLRQLREKKSRAQHERVQKRMTEGQSEEDAEHEELPESQQKHEIRCDGCGATVEFIGSLTSSACPYCDTPLQRDKVHDAEDRIPTDGVLPFLVDRGKAKQQLVNWVNSRWFAPNEFRQYGVDGKFSGVYMPYWTFDSMTVNHYRGQRGDHYYVEVKDGDQTRREQRTRWTPMAGGFQRFFDDVLVLASRGLRQDLMQELEPWPLEQVVPFNQQMLAGYLARTYEVELEEGFGTARQRMDAAIAQDVRQRIGGDEQRIDSIHTHFGAVTFKHLLLPVWLLAYRYHETVYQVMINAATGEVQGERPYSAIKITIAVILGILVAVGLFLAFKR